MPPRRSDRKTKRTEKKKNERNFLSLDPDHSDQTNRRRCPGVLAGEHAGDRHRLQGHVYPHGGNAEASQTSADLLKSFADPCFDLGSRRRAREDHEGSEAAKRGGHPEKSTREEGPIIGTERTEKEAKGGTAQAAIAAATI